jgi:hypothetical protein
LWFSKVYIRVYPSPEHNNPFKRKMCVESMEKEKKPKKRVQIIAQAYYSRQDVQKAIWEFCKNRESVPRYLEGFGKRPDVLDYPTDVFSLVKKGATSFHCSEERWVDPLKIETGMLPEQYNNIRSGWDFLIDIDSPFLDYSKIAAKLIIRALEFNGVKNVGVKFSGSKGFHIIVPWEAFPKEVDGIQTKDMFPEWPRLIAGYIDEMTHDKLVEEILNTGVGKVKNEKEYFKIICKSSGEEAIHKKITKYLCPDPLCRAEVSSTKSVKSSLRCPSCNGNMEKVSSEEYYVCPSNPELTSEKNPDEFEKKATAEKFIDSVDIVLVASRHLFRSPYSLHEKTSLVSCVIDKDKVGDFDPKMADPLKIKIENYLPSVENEEAKQLLINALDWAKRENKSYKKFEGDSIDLKGLTITEEMFPEEIKKLLEGMKQDGRKRALSLLLAFFSSLEMPADYIWTQIDKWNKKNYKPLKEGYVRSQIDWYLKNPRMPQNYTNPIYKELGILSETHGLKNPINYTIREALRAKGRSQKKEYIRNKVEAEEKKN